jgi:hypothetical protein
MSGLRAAGYGFGKERGECTSPGTRHEPFVLERFRYRL